MSEILGGPLGRQARTGAPYRTWWTPLRVALLAAASGSALSLLTYSHCQRSGWKSPDVYVHMCYSRISDRYALFATLAIVALALTTLLLTTMVMPWTHALLFPLAPAVILTLMSGPEAIQALVAVSAIYLLKRTGLNYLLIARIVLFIALVVLLFTRNTDPQYIIVLTPLTLIAGISRRDFLIWQGLEVIFQILFWQSVATINGAEKGLPMEGKSWALWIHLAATIYLAARLLEKSDIRGNFL